MKEWSAETTIFSSSSVSSMVCMSRPILERTAGLVTAAARADGDHRHSVGACDELPRRLRIEAREGADAHRDLRAVDAVDRGAADDDVDLFLARLALVVLGARHVRRHLEPVDPERLDAELPAHEPDRAAGSGCLDVVDVHHRVAHSALL